MLDINFFLIHPVSTSSSWNVGILHHITVNTSDSQTFSACDALRKFKKIRGRLTTKQSCFKKIDAFGVSAFGHEKD